MSVFTLEELRLIEDLHRKSRPIKPNVQCQLGDFLPSEDPSTLCKLQFVDKCCRKPVLIMFTAKEEVGAVLINMAGVKHTSIVRQ